MSAPAGDAQEHGGTTDLHNLLPLCVTHHHAVHHRHWQLTLTPNRQLTITYPDGTTNHTAPPRRHPHRQPLAPNTPVTVPYPAYPVIPLRT